MNRAPMLLAGLFVACLGLAPFAVAQAQPKDYKDIDLAAHGIPAVEPMKDSKTGFIVGGKNKTSVIEKLTEINGLKIATLEKAMRPGKSSKSGFLGKDENLLDIMAADNRFVVEQLGLTHQELARHLHAMGVIAAELRKQAKADTVEFVYHGRRFRVKREDFRGQQPSPFGDDTKSGSNVEVVNLDSGKKLWYGLLVPYMVERYGFYEGKGTPYRVDPAKVLEVFDFVKAKKQP